MSLDHEVLMMDRISAGADSGVKLTPEEKKFQKLMESKQKFMVDQSRSYMESLFSENSTIPIKVKNVQVTNAQSFRDSFLESQLLPLLNENLYTLGEFFNRLDLVHSRLVKLDILESSLISLHQLPKPVWNQKPVTVDLVPVFNIVPQKRFYAKTGTNIGNGEGDGYIQFQLKNVFGGAESLMLDAVTGTKTPSSYLASYSQPLLNSAFYSWETLAFVNTRKLDWIQSSVHITGITTKVSSRYDLKINFDVSVENCWRALNNHASRSLEVLSMLKDTFKSSVLFNIRYDARNHPVLPTAGKFARVGLEYSGLFRFNNVNFLKLVGEGQIAHNLSENHSLLFTSKSGFLFALGNRPTDVLDRFHLGGPNDVRSFALNGLGPKDNNSSVGGDYFLNGGVSLISQIPKAPHDTNFKFHNFVNFGKLLPLDKAGGLSGIARLLSSQYSVSCGTGLLYNHPMARFELNFVLPISAHGNDYIRKGIQYGVGVSFL